LTQGLEC